MKEKNISIPAAILGATLGLVVCGCISQQFEKKDCEKYSYCCALKITTKWGDDYWNVNAGQQVLNIRTAEWSAMAEAELYLIYGDLAARLDDRHQKKLADEQSRWVKTRDRKAKADADQFLGGTMWSMEYSAFRGGWNSRRLQALKNWLDKLKQQSSPAVPTGCPPQKLDWFPSILFLTTYEQLWADEMSSGNDKTRTWHHWAEFQDMKLQLAYAYLHLNLPTKVWQPLALESTSWPEEKANLLAQSAESADELDKRLGRAAVKRLERLMIQFPILIFEQK